MNDAYFGKVPPDRLKVDGDDVFYSGDGESRGKIGISPKRSKGIAGSYDPAGGVLTLIFAATPEHYFGYVNSMWEQQAKPYDGDVINSYNDGPPEPGKPALGHFFEVESSSPAAALAPGESIQHKETTIHLQGTPEKLDGIARRMLGASLERIQAAVKPSKN